MTNNPFVVVASHNKDDFLLLHIMGQLGLCSWLLTRLKGADTDSNIASHRGRRKELWRELHTAIKCPDMA